MKIRSNKAWSTHMPMLIKCVQMSDGPVLEIGSGLFSTPLLHWLCYEKGRKLITYENNLDYFSFAKSFQSRNHRIRFIKDWDEIDTEAKMHWSVVLIDHTPEERRKIDAIRLKEKADYIIIHDTDCESKYGFDEVWPHFKYRYDWRGCRPWTTVVSNFKDVSKIEKPNITK